MALQREPMKELESYVRENNVDHKALLGAVTEYITQLRMESVSKQEKDLPLALRQTVVAFHGDINYIKERKGNKGYFIVTYNDETGYSVVLVDEIQDEYILLAINDFPEKEEAIDYVRVLERSMQTQEPEHHQLSELKMFNVNDDGFYVGRERYDSSSNEWRPFSRVNSKPMTNRHEAESFLEQVLKFRKDILSNSTGNLKVLAESFHEQVPEDPWNEIRRNVVIDELRANHNLKPHVIAELCRR